MQTKWKIVPVEPTEIMRLSGFSRICEGLETRKHPGIEGIYKAMLSVAPPCEDLETVRAALLIAAHADTHPTFNVKRSATEALAALGRIRGEG